MSHIRKTDTILITVAVKTIRKEEDLSSRVSGASFGIFSTTFFCYCECPKPADSVQQGFIEEWYRLWNLLYWTSVNIFNGTSHEAL